MATFSPYARAVNAVRAACFGIFFHQGQVCMANSRLIVEEAVYDEFCAKVAARAKTYKVGDPHDPQTVIGPLIVTVGPGVAELWHMVQVDPLLPDTPEMPFGYAKADNVNAITASTTKAATEKWGSFRCITFS